MRARPSALPLRRTTSAWRCRLRADAGQMTTGIYLLDTRKDAVSTDIQAQGSTLLQLSWVGSSRFWRCTIILRPCTTRPPAEQARFEYGDHLLDASISGSMWACCWVQRAGSPSW